MRASLADPAAPAEVGRPVRTGSAVDVSRRAALFGGLCLCCLPRLGHAAPQSSLEEVAEGIFVRRGPDVETTPDNDGAIANIGFIVGRDGVLVTESGGSRADGAWLRAEIRKRTDKPIRHVVMSHVHPDHCFGASAFLEDKPVFVGHKRLRPALESRGAFYRERLAEILGPDRAGTVVYPTLEVAEGAEIDLGDRRVAFTAHAVAHSSCDLSMLDRRTGTLFPGDLLFVGRVPSLDGSLLGWLKAVDVLKTSGARNAVPGHGPPRVATTGAFADLTRYLTKLRDETRAAIADGGSIETAVATVAHSERDQWSLFESYNGRNVTQVYKELEWE